VTVETKLEYVGKAQRDARGNGELADSGESGKADGGDVPVLQDEEVLQLN
jgi:hypothetical protein